MKKLVIAISMATAMLNQAVYAEGNETEQQSEPLQEASLADVTDLILSGSPEEIIKARKQIIRSGAAQRLPVIETFDDIAEPLLDIEETFEITRDGLK